MNTDRVAREADFTPRHSYRVVPSGQAQGQCCRLVTRRRRAPTLKVCLVTAPAVFQYLRYLTYPLRGHPREKGPPAHLRAHHRW
eukprot:1192104-Prorocentrum_minimum.AAC.1